MSKLFAFLVILALVMDLRAVELNMGANYRGYYRPDGHAEPYDVDGWQSADGTLQAQPNTDAGVFSQGKASFLDDSTSKRFVVYYPCGTAFGDDPEKVEYAFMARVKFAKAGASMPAAQLNRAAVGIGFHDESGTNSSGRQVTLGFFISDEPKGELGSPCIGFIGDGGVLIHRVSARNWMDDKMHEYRVKKYLVGGVVRLAVSIDGETVDDSAAYKSLPVASGEKLGFSYSTSTQGTINATIEEFSFGHPRHSMAIGPLMDPRDIRTGGVIYSHGYADQPYVVVNADKSLTCIMTVGGGQEGETGQRVVSVRSEDGGKSWSAPIPLEATGAPENSWGLPVLANSGRIYALYTFNETNLREVLDYNGQRFWRVDAVGQFVFRYSDDQGRSWSAKRYNIPIRVTEMDRNNVYKGDVNRDGIVNEKDPKFFWSPAAAYSDGRSVFVGIAKIKNFDPLKSSTGSEGWVFKSPNVLSESDPGKVTWNLLPEGAIGLRSRSGTVSEETTVTKMTDGTLVAICRTTEGIILTFYSKNEGKSWTAPTPLCYAVGKQPLRHPRAKPCLWSLGAGKYLVWFENNGTIGFDNRNPAWCAIAEEQDGRLVCSQPEIILYDRDESIRMSYPDFFTLNGRYYITETQKYVARIHEIPAKFLTDLINQRTSAKVAVEGLSAQWQSNHGRSFCLPSTPDIQTKGFTLEFWVRLKSLDRHEVLFDATERSGAGIKVEVNASKIGFSLSDGKQTASLNTEGGRFILGKWNHVVCVVEPGPRIMMSVVNGQFCDGGTDLEFGWTRYPRELTGLGKPSSINVSHKVSGTLGLIRYYERPLSVSEAVSNYNAGFKN